MEQGKVLVVETWFVIANFLAFEFVPSPAGSDTDANRQCATGLCFPTDRSAASFIPRLYTRRLGSERNKCFGIAEPISALILIARSMLMVSSGFSRAFLLLTQLVTFKVP